MIQPKTATKRMPRIPKCPVCSVRTDASRDSFPFCSPRCRQVDLSRWLNGEYCISRPIAESDLDEV